MSDFKPPDIQPKKSHLLVVDDSEINRHLIQRMFEIQGYTTESAEDGKKALEALEKNTFDLVLLDVMMPEMDGLTALEHIRAQDAFNNLPVILISAMSDTRDVVRGLELGANDYLTKPIDMEIARARVKTQLTIKTLIDERNKTINQLEETQKMREQFFRIASHDLKQPLTSLRVATVLLKELAAKDNEHITTIVDTMAMTIGSMNEVVSEFLDFAALQTGYVDMKLKEVNSRDLMWDVVGQYNAIAYEKNIKIHMQETNFNVICDPARFAQVLGNVVSNAIKYSPVGSKVRLWTTTESEHLRIHVADQGKGIPPEEHINLFQPFGKLNNEPTAGESSHGLGLWIASHLIKLQNGDIGVNSPETGGAEFWVTIPLAPEKIESVASGSS
jgi:two-component system sensor histidine kinase/response regulator